MNNKPIRRTRREERELQANRQRMDEYVYQPSDKAAAYWGQVGFGAACALIGIIIRSNYAGAFAVGFYTILIAVAIPFTFMGVGGLFMLNRRLGDFWHDILDNKTKAISEEIYHFEDENDDGVRPMAVKSGSAVKKIVDIPDPKGFHAEELRAFAVAVMCHQTGMTKDAITKRTSKKHNATWPYWKVSQPKWSDITSWMIKQGMATVDLGKTELTPKGYDHFLTLVPDHEIIRLKRPED